MKARKLKNCYTKADERIKWQLNRQEQWQVQSANFVMETMT